MNHRIMGSLRHPSKWETNPAVGIVAAQAVAAKRYTCTAECSGCCSSAHGLLHSAAVLVGMSIILCQWPVIPTALLKIPAAQ